MMDPGECERMSVLLSEYLDRAMVGTQEEVDIKRRGRLINESIANHSNNDMEKFFGGSRGEGIDMATSDHDIIDIDNEVEVMQLGQCSTCNSPDSALKTVLYMRDGNCRPGYVTLELDHVGQKYTRLMYNSLVQVGDAIFASSDIYREECVKSMLKTSTGLMEFTVTSNGPCSTLLVLGTEGVSIDFVTSFPCNSWPKVAKEWITRPRVYGWPPQTLIDDIKNSGCHFVPVGDKCSEDMWLQWRMSFGTAERRLVHSLSHVQFKVYCLLKYFLKQIKQTLTEVIGDEDILCSYFFKTIIFWAVENSQRMFWQDKNFFICFWFCLNILIAWVKAGYCPNYFIPANNMFKRKVDGQNKQILFCILKQIHEMKLSISQCFVPILPHLYNTELQTELMCPPTPHEREYGNDMATMNIFSRWECTMAGALKLHLKSQSEVDEVITYYNTVRTLFNLAMDAYPDHVNPTDNKTRYRNLKKCKNWLIPRASMGTELLYLATFHFLCGNYKKTLQMCNHIVSKELYYFPSSEHSEPEEKAKYMHEYCGQGNTLFYKIKNVFAQKIYFTQGSQFCIPHLHLELSKAFKYLGMPPLPYALFLSFLCCHELGDTRGREAALRNMIVVKYDAEQGGHKYWIVHTLVGICHQTLGDNRRAIRAYWDSHTAFPVTVGRSTVKECNPALERIEALQNCDSG